MSNRANIKKLIENHQRRLQILKEQQALYGQNTSPHILIEIRDIELEIEKLKMELEELETDTADKVHVYMWGNFVSLSEDQKLAAINAFAAIVGIPPQAIKMYRVQ